MAIRFNAAIVLIFIISIVLIPGCSIFKPAGPSSEGLTQESSKEKFRLFKDHQDKNNNNQLFGEDDFTQYNEDEAENKEPDSTLLLDTFIFDDTMMSFSDNRMNDSRIADELVKESHALYTLDSLVILTFFDDDKYLFDRDSLNVYDYPEDYIPTFSDSVYASRIAKLNRTMPFDLTYNKTVKTFIDLYAVRKRGLSSRILGLSEVYFPLFEEVLDQQNMPLELKYLAIVESALIPTAGSHAGAKGLWQFMYNTGKVYGLKATSLVDDRFDPYKSTVAAGQHLKDLYDIYQDWWLVLAAYNSGAGNVNKAIRRAGGVKNYWAIWPYLPKETRGYVPAFIAVTYLMNHAAEHNLYPVHPGILYNAIDTVHVYDVLSFDQISEFINIPVSDLKYLNPSYKQGIIPASPDDKYILRLPRSLSGFYVSNEAEIYNFKSIKGLEKEKLLTQVEEVSQRQLHTVKKGETLGGIAKKYHTSVSKLQSWNNLKGTTIRPGQKLVINSSYTSAGDQNETPGSSPAKTSGEQSYHVVKSGENLGLIAKKYKCSTDDLKKWNNLRSNTIQPNQKLVVYKPDSQANQQSELAQSSGSADVKYVYYTVKPGDTLWDIAKQYNGVTVEDLKRLNKITNAQSLKPGQKIRIAVAT